MKFLRYGEPGQEKPGVLDAKGQIRDLSAKVSDLSGAVLSPEALAKLGDLDIESLPVVSGNPRLGPCVAGTGKFICIGLNYADHAAESGMAVPPEPVIFMKATSAIVGPNDDLVIPRGSEKTDWEVELGVVIGRTAKYVTEADALDYVAGYCTVHDVSERAFQTERAGQWTKGKSCDTFGPTGPWLVTKDEVADPQNLAMWLTVNRSHAEWLDQDDGLWCCLPRFLSQPVHEPAPGRYHLDWHTSRSWHRHQAAALS